MRSKFVLNVLLASLVPVVFAANPTERRWIAVDGFVNDVSSWSDNTPPVQGSATDCGEMAHFRGTGDKTVRMPATGWTDTGVYYFAKDILDGSTLTFDATDSWWLFAPGRYYSGWQVFTLSGGAVAGVSYPHILEVSLKNGATATAPVFKLTDGVVKLVKDAACGTVLSLERGEWNFRDSDGTVTSQNQLTLFKAEGSSAEDRFVLQAGSSLRASDVSLTPGSAIPSARFLVEGGAHLIDNLTIGAAKDAAKGDSTTPVVAELAGGSLTAGTVVVGRRSTTGENHLVVTNDAVFAVGMLEIGKSAKGATVALKGSSRTTVSRDLHLASAMLKIADDADVTVEGWFYPNIGMAAGDRSETIVGGRARLRLMAENDRGAEAGALYFGGSNTDSSSSVASVKITDDAWVETAARTTIGNVSAASNVLEICGNGTFVNTDDYGIILGRGKGGRGYLVVRDNATVNLTGGFSSLALSGDLQWGDNLGSEERVDILGGTVTGAAGLSLAGTNAWVNLAGGTTTFKTWSVSGEPKYKITDEDWVLPTNTIHVTGGIHAVSGYNNSSVSIAIGSTNGNTRILFEGGEVNASSMLQVGCAAMAGNPAVLTMAGGRLTLAQKNNAATGDSKVMVGQPSGSKGRIELLGGEIIANSIRGGSGQSTLIADGGSFTVLNTVAGDWALSRFTTASLGAKGLTVNVPAGLTAVNRQTFTDLEDAAGLFVKSGVGTLVTSNASAHAQTRVDAGVLVYAAGVTQFGRRLAIEENAFVLVDVPAEVGEHHVLTLAAELSADELLRVQPQVWATGFDYVMSQRTEGGVTTVVCTVAAGGPAARTVTEATAYDTPQTLATGLSVAANVSVTFNAPVTVVGTELVVDVAAGAVVTFAQPISSAVTAVRKVGAGRVAFTAVNPGFLGTWTQDGGVFDVQEKDFGVSSTGLTIVKDTFRYADSDAGTFDAPVLVAAGTPQKRVVANIEQDLTVTRGWNSTGGGLVKTGAGTLTIVEPRGTFSLNTGSVAAGDDALGSVPADGSSPADAAKVQNNATAGAALQVLSGVVRVMGVGADVTTVNNQQTIYVGTGFVSTAQPGLEISDCTYVADGTTRSTILAAGTKAADFNAPYLFIRDAVYKSHRMLLGSRSPSVDVYPTVTIVNSTVTFESGFNVGQNNDKIHPRLTLDNSTVTQYRLGYAMGHYFCRDFDVTLTNNAVLNATYTSNAGGNWHGVRFESGAWGTLRVTTGSKIQTSRIESLNTEATAERHVDFIFDGGILEMTSDNSGVTARTVFAVPAHQGFTSTGAGMEVALAEGVTHTFATPFRGEAAVMKTGAGVLAVDAVSDGEPVFRGTGDVVVREGVIDLGGQVETTAAFVGAGGVVRNGTCAVKVPASATTLLELGDATTVGRVVLPLPDAGWENGQKVPVAAIADGAAVSVANGCKVETGDATMRGIAAVVGGQVVVTVETRKGVTIFIR